MTKSFEGVHDRLLRDLTEHAVAAYPLVALGAAWASETLTIWGDGWSFSTMSSWRLSRNGAFVASSSHDPEIAADLLRNTVLVEVRARPGLAADDPVLSFDCGLLLEVTCDLPVEPWVFKFAGLTFVPADIAESRA